jgi:hypothetical protein
MVQVNAQHNQRTFHFADRTTCGRCSARRRPMVNNAFTSNLNSLQLFPPSKRITGEIPHLHLCTCSAASSTVCALDSSTVIPNSSRPITISTCKQIQEKKKVVELEENI